MRNSVLFLNGERSESLPDIGGYEGIYCTDGAYDFLVAKQIIPDAIIGDFDSISPEKINPAHSKLIHIQEQDSTDFEKALNYLIDLQITELDVYGASGREHDHFLGNLSTAKAYMDKINIEFYDDFSYYKFIPAGKEIKANTIIGKKVSLIPFPYAHKVYATGLQYPVEGLNFELGTYIGTRNIAIQSDISISYKSGCLLLFLQL